MPPITRHLPDRSSLHLHHTSVPSALGARRCIASKSTQHACARAQPATGKHCGHHARHSRRQLRPATPQPLCPQPTSARPGAQVSASSSSPHQRCGSAFRPTSWLGPRRSSPSSSRHCRRGSRCRRCSSRHTPQKRNQATLLQPHLGSTDLEDRGGGPCVPIEHTKIDRRCIASSMIAFPGKDRSSPITATARRAACPRTQRQAG